MSFDTIRSVVLKDETSSGSGQDGAGRGVYRERGLPVVAHGGPGGGQDSGIVECWGRAAGELPGSS